MSEISRLIDQFEREHDGDAWHGSPLWTIVHGISHEQAAARPVAGAHSIWELVLHMTAWTNEVRRRLTGAPAAEPEEGDWPAVGDVTAAGWQRARDGLGRAQKALLDDLRAIPESKLYEPTNDARDPALGTGVSYYVLLHGLVQHDVYHSGQIALLKKAL